MAVEPALALLNQGAFNLVQRPEVRLSPLDVLGRDDVLEHVGTLSAVVPSPRPLPEVEGPHPAPEFAGQQTELMHVDIAERILVRLLHGLGSAVERVTLGDRPGRVRFLRFSFDDVEILSSPPQAVAAYLLAGQPAPGPIRERYIDNPEADAYVVTRVLQSRSIRVLPLDVGTAPVPCDLPVLARTVGHTTIVSQEGPWIRFRGTSAATIAFACYRVAFAGDTWGLEGDQGHPILIAPGTRLMVTPGRGALAS
jgi:hypothetical protein